MELEALEKEYWVHYFKDYKLIAWDWFNPT